ncbi:uncharacterized protein TNCV_429741 [Trichonephila clavipes]|nr:uncharacterized protein TNCV_429741 [Trichonephila clavipes]
METNIFKQAVWSKMTSSSSCPVFRNLSNYELSILLNPVILVSLCFCLLDLPLLSLLELRGASDRGICRSKWGDQRKTCLPSVKNFMVTHPGQTNIDKSFGERLSTTYFRAATVGNDVKGFQKCGIETHNPLVFDFAASKATDLDVVGDETENNSANSQILVAENQHINPSEEPELMANSDYDAQKKPDSVFFISNHCLKQHNGKKMKEKAKKVSLTILTSTSIKEMLERREKQKKEQETLQKQRR